MRQGAADTAVMKEIRDASFAARLGALLTDVIVLVGAQVIASLLLAAVFAPFGDRNTDPVDFISPQSAFAVVVTVFAVPIGYLALSLSRLSDHRSVGQRLFRLRVIRDER